MILTNSGLKQKKMIEFCVNKRLLPKSGSKARVLLNTTMAQQNNLNSIDLYIHVYIRHIVSMVAFTFIQTKTLRSSIQRYISA